MASTQPSKLLSTLFEHQDEEARITVLHIGPALSETVEFFSRYRCKLYFVDLFGELPILAEEDVPLSLEKQFAELLKFPSGTYFDIALFWDVFNYMSSDAIIAFLITLRPHLRPDSLAHGFAVHNLRNLPSEKVYGINDLEGLSVSQRPTSLPGYAPHNQSRLKTLLSCFQFDRSVLLSDSRLELLLSAKL
ncbi:MAG: hypothetical protein ACJAYC_001706 [Halieaceae bacterium]|jgi:hypothetical protein